MSEETPVWRQALKHEKHPLHRAAWMLFSKDFSQKYAERLMTEQRDEIVAFCKLILDADELYAVGALGGGDVPAHAVELLCTFKVEEALPRLIQILAEDGWESDIYGITADEIASFGTIIVDPLLEIATKAENEQEITAIAGTLADAAPGDARTIEFTRKIFDSSKEAYAINYMAANVLRADPEGGVKWLEGRLRTHKYSKDIRKTLEKYIEDAKAGRL